MGKSTSYAGKTVLITGSARGIGWESAKRLHAGGAKVSLVGLEPDLLAERVQSLGAERAAWFEADVTSVEQLQAAVDGTVAKFGGIDVAIANAGVHYVGSFNNAPLAQIERELEINLFGVVRTDKVVLPHLVKSGGYLLNIASLAAATHAPLMSAYASSKAGVEALTNAIRVEMVPQGVGVGCAYFGFIDTDMVRDAFSDESTKTLEKLMPGFIRKTVTVDHAVDAIERAILNRSDRTWAPRYVGGVLAGRGIAQPLSEKRMLAAKGRLLKAIGQADESVVRDRAAEATAASKAAKAGGAKTGAAKSSAAQKSEKAGAAK